MFQKKMYNFAVMYNSKMTPITTKTGDIAKKELTVGRLFQLTEQCFATPDGKPLKLAKPKKELSHDIDLLNNFFRPEST